MNRMTSWVMVLIMASVMASVMAGCASNQTKTSDIPPIDRISDAELSRIMLKPNATLSLDEIIGLSKAGKSPDQIIEKIKTSNSYYDLTPSQSVQLSKQGVDNKVLDYIYESRELALRNNVAEEINKRERAKKNAERQLERNQDFYYPYGYGAYPYWWGTQFYWGPSIYYRRHR